MQSDELCSLGVFDLARLYRRGELSPVEVVEAHLQRIERLTPLLNAFLKVLPEPALEAAKAAQALLHAGVDLGPLQGVPVSVKDLMRLRGVRTTAGSRVLLNEAPDQEDAAIVRHLRKAGAVIIGKTNLHEFASGDPEPGGPFGLVQNPRRIGCHPGMSSSGAGAAVAAGLGVVGLGTDTGGSIRIPACLCGTAGLKPTNGRIDMEGIIPLSWTLDTAGPLGRRVGDVAAAFAACARGGWPAPGRAGMHSLEILKTPVRGWRIGRPVGDYFEKLQPAVEKSFSNTWRVLKDLGCQIVDFEAPGVETMGEMTLVITRAEAALYHERHRGQESLYGPNFLKERLFPGRELKALDYLAARERQKELQAEWTRRMEGLEALVMPAAPIVAPPHGAGMMELGGEAVYYRSLLSRFTRPFNLLAWPALSLPDGRADSGLPTAVQIVGPPESELRLLRLGQQVEDVLGLVAKLGIEPVQPG